MKSSADESVMLCKKLAKLEVLVINLSSAGKIHDRTTKTYTTPTGGITRRVPRIMIR